MGSRPVWATASTAWATAVPRAGQRGLDDPGGARPEQAPLAPEYEVTGDGRVATWAHATAAPDRHRDYCGRCGRTPPSRLAPPPSERPGRAQPCSHLMLGVDCSSTYLARAAHRDLAWRWRRLRYDRRATPSAEPPTRPAA
jgi:hypothetical protein